MKKALDYFWQVRDFPAQCAEALKLGKSLKIKQFSPRNLLFLGMGGSAIGGSLLKAYLEDFFPLPVLQSQDYQIPAFVDQDCLVFAVSYSGNTAETLSAFEAARKSKAQLVTLSSGGKLKELGEKFSLLHIDLPPGFQPRAAAGFTFLLPLLVLGRLGLIPSPEAELEQAIGELTGRFYREFPLELARSLQGKIPLIYAASPWLYPLALRWKTEFNENGKIPAFANFLPELCHNEIMMWQADSKLLEKFYLIILAEQKIDKALKLRLKFLKNRIKKQCGISEIIPETKSRLSTILALIYLGDLTSLELAVLNRVNPESIPLISELKAELKKAGLE